MKSILMLGQSNMAGRGFINEVPLICNERIQMLRNGRWQIMTEPINYDKPVAGVGLAGSFAAMWCMENEEDKIGLIPCAEGGSSLEEWAIDKVLFRHAVSEAKFALQNSELMGILWHQGESDSYGGKYQNYYKELKVIVEALRIELNAPEIPFIIGGLGNFLGKTASGLNCPEYKLINHELLRFSNEQNYCFFVTSEELTSNPDGIHLNAISQRKFGIRYYKAFTQRKNVLDPLENELELMDACINKSHTKNEKMHLEMMDFALDKVTYEAFIENLGKIQSD